MVYRRPVRCHADTDTDTDTQTQTQAQTHTKHRHTDTQTQTQTARSNTHMTLTHTRTCRPGIREGKREQAKKLPVDKRDAEHGAAEIDHPAGLGEEGGVILHYLALAGDVVADRGLHFMQLVLHPLAEIPVLSQNACQPFAREHAAQLLDVGAVQAQTKQRVQIESSVVLFSNQQSKF